MNDKNDFDTSSDDDFYDDALDENFEFEDDYEDIDLESELDDSDSDFEDGLDDEWEEEAEAPEAYAEQKPSFINFNTIVIAGAVVVGVLIMVFQVQKSAPSKNQTQASVQQTIPTALRMGGVFEGPGAAKPEEKAKETVENKNKEESEKEEEGFLFDVDTLADAPPMPSPIVAEEKEAPLVSLREETLLEATPAEETKSDVAEVPRAPEVNKQETANLSDELSQEIDLPDEFLKKDDPIQALEKEELETISKKDEATEKVIATDQPDETLSAETIQPAPVVTGSLDTKLDKIIDRLEAMEKKIEDIENITDELKAVKTTQSSSVSSSSNTAPSKSKVQKASAPKVVKKKVRSRPVQKVSWELRAAQPGKAWVSQKGQKNMQPIVVGDKLTGIGRIENISYVNSRWVVQGSAGKIMQ